MMLKFGEHERSVRLCLLETVVAQLGAGR